MIDEIRSWNYAKTWTYFQITTASGVTEKFAEYAANLPQGNVSDFRGMSMPREILDKYVEEHKLIILDGTSLSGKTTFAKKLAKEYGINIVDVDEYLIKWLKEIVNAPLTAAAKERKIRNFKLTANDRLTNELEDILLKESDGGKKSVILVGVFIYDMQRFVVADKLGRLFGGAISFMLHEPMKMIKKRISERDKQFGSSTPENSMARIEKDYFVVSQVLSNEITMKYLGIGLEESFVVDHVTIGKLFKPH